MIFSISFHQISWKSQNNIYICSAINAAHNFSNRSVEAGKMRKKHFWHIFTKNISLIHIFRENYQTFLKTLSRNARYIQRMFSRNFIEIHQEIEKIFWTQFWKLGIWEIWTESFTCWNFKSQRPKHEICENYANKREFFDQNSLENVMRRGKIPSGQVRNAKLFFRDFGWG